MLIPVTQVDRYSGGPNTLRASAIGVPMSRRVCAILGRGDGQKAFAVRVIEAAGIGRLKTVHCINAISVTEPESAG